MFINDLYIKYNVINCAKLGYCVKLANRNWNEVLLLGGWVCLEDELCF